MSYRYTQFLNVPCRASCRSRHCLSSRAFICALPRGADLRAALLGSSVRCVGPLSARGRPFPRYHARCANRHWPCHWLAVPLQHRCTHSAASSGERLGRPGRGRVQPACWTSYVVARLVQLQRPSCIRELLAGHIAAAGCADDVHRP